MIRKLTELAENIKEIFWKLKCRKYRIFRSLIARYLAKENKSGMEKFGWKTMRCYLGKSSGLWVVAYLCSGNPFGSETSLPAGDNCIGISNHIPGDTDGSRSKPRKSHDSDSPSTRQNRNHQYRRQKHGDRHAYTGTNRHGCHIPPYGKQGCQCR